ncbi:MAG: type II toxin-antitoxin system HicA family toxin [Coriobacteriia bacterium]|nr:type II toxin-antitoxin system HicA family toxin [Coriobacteriia bacterium]
MPSWKELRRYCERDGWECYKSTDHDFYRKVLPDGTVLRTKVSRGHGQINGRLWQEILRRQLKTTQEHFNKII